MPLEIVRNDIVNMRVDAIVNTANPNPIIGAGVDNRIHKAAGENLLRDRINIGRLEPGQMAITNAYDLKARYVIHVSGPVWRDGTKGEQLILRKCYTEALLMAQRYGCKSIAFPLISAGNYRFPEELALSTAMEAFTEFLEEHDMEIYLVVFSREAVALSEGLVESVKQYIDDAEARNTRLEEYGIVGCDDPIMEDHILQRRMRHARRRCSVALPRLSEEAIGAELDGALKETELPLSEEKRQPDAILWNVAASRPAPPPTAPFPDLESAIRHMDAGFSRTLLAWVDKKGMTDPEVYHRANISKQVYSRLRSDPGYVPSIYTAAALAIALKLNLEETQDLLGRAGLALSGATTFGLIVRYCIEKRMYNVHDINQLLFRFDQHLLGAGR